ncbi:unnamed protein product, partial [Chrysoparadoxa australica]
ASPFEDVTLRVDVSLLPSSMGDMFRAIRENMYKLLMRYSPSTEGVVLAVSDVSFPEGEHFGRILDDMPHIHVAVHARALVFRPRPGDSMIGVVTKVASTHIGMLVCGIFNAAVYSKDLGEGWQFDQAVKVGKEGEGLPLFHYSRVQAGSEIGFVVRRLHEAQGLISLEVP